MGDDSNQDLHMDEEAISKNSGEREKERYSVEDTSHGGSKYEDKSFTSSGKTKNKYIVPTTSSCWLPIDKNSLPRSKYSPRAVINYLKPDVPKAEANIDVKLLLLDEGWKIERKKHKKKVRYRYTSPNGKSCYYSLCKLCLDLSNSSSGCGNWKVKGKRSSRKRKKASWHENFRVVEIGSTVSGRKAVHLRGMVEGEQSLVGYNTPVMKRKKKKRHALKCLGKSAIKPEQCPQAVVDYYELEGSPNLKKTDPKVNMKQAISKAKMHLSYDGWKFRYVAKKNGKELRYVSPAGRHFISLRTACKEWVEKAGLQRNGKTPMAEDADDGRSLLDCQMQMVQDNQLKERNINSNKPLSSSESICTICHYEGDLVLCDYCPSCFHLKCIGLQDAPQGEWFCPSCRCYICDRGKYDCEKFTEETVIYCDQCELEYHVGCLRERGVEGLDRRPKGYWFCSKECSKIFRTLRLRLGKSIPTTVDCISWTLLRSRKGNRQHSHMSDINTPDVNNSKLSAALTLMHECFGIIVEPLTERDLITDAIFNSESDLNRLNFWGMYIMILEKGDQLLSVAMFRVHGATVAEMPLICTTAPYRRQGMCRLLVNELERMLSNLGVKKLLLPAPSAMLEKWTTSYGFARMTDYERFKLANHVFLDFQESIMCQKVLQASTEGSMELAEMEHEVPHGISNRDQGFDQWDSNWVDELEVPDYISNWDQDFD